MESRGFHVLVRRAQEGDRAAMDQVLESLRPHLERLARPFADPARPAESTADLLQESCLRAWQKVQAFQGGRNDEETFAMFRAWIGQIVRTLGLQGHRGRERQKRKPPGKLLSLDRRRPGQTTQGGDRADPVAPEASPSSHVRLDERAEQIRKAVDRVADESDAAILRLRFLDGKTYEEIGEELGLSYHQVRERYRSTLRELREDLEDLV